MSALPRHTTVRELVRTFGPDLWVHRRAMAAGYLYRTIAIGVTLLAPWPLKVIIDHVVGTRPPPRIISLLGPGLSKEALVGVMAALIVVLALMRALAETLQATTNARLRERLNMQLRDRMLAHLQTLPPTIRTSHRSGELVMRLVGDVDLFIRLQIKTLPAIFEHGVTSIATMTLMFWLQPVLALVTVAMLPGLAVLVRHYGIRLGRASREKRRREGEVAGLAQEIVRGLPAIQALGGEQFARERFRRLNARSLEAGVDETRATAEMERTLRTAYGVAPSSCCGAASLSAR
jgi:ATP-binding cassette subfamily B protein